MSVGVSVANISRWSQSALSVGSVSFFVSLKGVRLATDRVAAVEWMAARRATLTFVLTFLVQVDLSASAIRIVVTFCHNACYLQRCKKCALA